MKTSLVDKPDCEDCNEWIDAVKRVIDEIKKLEEIQIRDRFELPSYGAGRCSAFSQSRKLLESLLE